MELAELMFLDFRIKALEEILCNDQRFKKAYEDSLRLLLGKLELSELPEFKQLQKLVEAHLTEFK